MISRNKIFYYKPLVLKNYLKSKKKFKFKI